MFLVLVFSPVSSGAPYEVAVDFFLAERATPIFGEFLYASRKNKDRNKSVTKYRNSSLLYLELRIHYKQERLPFPIVSFLLYEIVNQNPIYNNGKS